MKNIYIRLEAIRDYAVFLAVLLPTVVIVFAAGITLFGAEGTVNAPKTIVPIQVAASEL